MVFGLFCDQTAHLEVQFPSTLITFVLKLQLDIHARPEMSSYFMFVFLYSVLTSIWSGRGSRHQTVHSSRDSSMTSGSASTTGTGVEGEFQNNSRESYCKV